jgi:photosynthetic reaction center cytochrome c subunit
MARRLADHYRRSRRRHRPGNRRGRSGAIATLYFDKACGLLVRQVRYAQSPVGRIPTQIDYADCRDVSGIKMPFRWTVIWLDGRDTVQLDEVRVNVPIDAAKFAPPAPSR